MAHRMLSEKPTSRASGLQAEILACEYLSAQGLKLITRNYRVSCGEIDLIMWDNDYLVFIEVRFRQDTDYGSGIETITKSKQNRIIKAALFYLQQEKLLDKVLCRFDVIGMGAAEKIEWIKNAFEVTY